jgi:hypothetical protein
MGKRCETQETIWQGMFGRRGLIGRAQVKVVGLIRRNQGGRQVNGKARGGP